MSEYTVKMIKAMIGNASGISKIEASDKAVGEAVVTQLRGARRTAGRYNPATDEGKAWSDTRVTIVAYCVMLARIGRVVEVTTQGASAAKAAIRNDNAWHMKVEGLALIEGDEATDQAVGMAMIRLSEMVSDHYGKPLRIRAVKMDGKRGPWSVLVTSD